MNVGKSLSALSLAGFLGSCSDFGPGGEPQSRAPIVSEPVHSAASVAAAGGLIELRAAGDVYVSLSPNTISAGDRVVVRNLVTPDITAGTALLDGGFDPVRMLAEVGDTLELIIWDGVTASETMLAVVPPRRRPKVVRTIPPRGKTDVPLNSRVTVVFSEPLDRTSVSSENIQLRLGTQSVAGQVRLSVDGLVAEFLPDRALDPEVGYTLVVGAGVKDLSGDFLEEIVEVPFTTAKESDGPFFDAPPDLASARIVFAKSIDESATETYSHLYSMNGDGSDQRQLTDGPHDDLSPAVSPDRTKIAFSRDGDIHVMNVDGTDIQRLTTVGGRDPAWSPDGARIVFVGQPNGLYVLSVEGGNISRLTATTDDPYFEPVWSPDGNQIAFTRVELDFAGAGSLTCVWIINADGTGETRLCRREGTGPSSRTWASWSPVWSPDGGRIALAGPDELPGVGMFAGLFVMNSDGSDAVLLARQPVVGGNAVLRDWSADGKWIVYAVEASGVANIYAVNIYGQIVRITTDGRSRTPSFFE